MNLDLFRFSPGAYLAPAVDWLNKNFHPFFDALTKLIEAVLGAIETALLYPPPYATIVVAFLLAAFFVSVRVSVVTAIALAFCLLAGFWTASMQTLALVTVAISRSRLRARRIACRRRGRAGIGPRAGPSRGLRR